MSLTWFGKALLLYSLPQLSSNNLISRLYGDDETCLLVRANFSVREDLTYELRDRRILTFADAK